MTGHLGRRVSALLDGQLAAEEEERCWRHVHACHACRDLVEREGWVKARLSGLGDDAADLSGALRLSLRDPGARDAPPPARGAGAPAGPAVRVRARPAVLALGGAGAGAVALGVVLLGVAPGGGPEDLRPPTGRLSGPASGSASAATGHVRDVDARVPQPVWPGHRFVPVRSTAP